MDLRVRAVSASPPAPSTQSQKFSFSQTRVSVQINNNIVRGEPIAPLRSACHLTPPSLRGGRAAPTGAARSLSARRAPAAAARACYAPAPPACASSGQTCGDRGDRGEVEKAVAEGVGSRGRAPAARGKRGQLQLRLRLGLDVPQRVQPGERRRRSLRCRPDRNLGWSAVQPQP